MSLSSHKILQVNGILAFSAFRAAMLLKGQMFDSNTAAPRANLILITFRTRFARSEFHIRLVYTLFRYPYPQCTPSKATSIEMTQRQKCEHPDLVFSSFGKMPGNRHWTF